MTAALIEGVRRTVQRGLDGARDGLKGAASGVTLDMRNDPAHGDQTGAAHASYSFSFL